MGVKTLRVLAAGIELQEFSIPELVHLCAVGHEEANEILERHAGYFDIVSPSGKKKPVARRIRVRDDKLAELKVRVTGLIPARYKTVRYRLEEFKSEDFVPASLGAALEHLRLLQTPGEAPAQKDDRRRIKSIWRNLSIFGQYAIDSGRIYKPLDKEWLKKATQVLDEALHEERKLPVSQRVVGELDWQNLRSTFSDLSHDITSQKEKKNFDELNSAFIFWKLSRYAKNVFEVMVPPARVSIFAIAILIIALLGGLFYYANYLEGQQGTVIYARVEKSDRNEMLATIKHEAKGQTTSLLRRSAASIGANTQVAGVEPENAAKLYYDSLLENDSGSVPWSERGATLEERIEAALARSAKQDAHVQTEQETPRLTQTRQQIEQLVASAQQSAHVQGPENDARLLSEQSIAEVQDFANNGTTTPQLPAANPNRSTTSDVGAAIMAAALREHRQASSQKEEVEVPEVRVATASAETPKVEEGVERSFYVQLGSRSDKDAATNSGLYFKKHYPSIIEEKTITIKQVDLGPKGQWYRIMLGPYISRNQANLKCEQIISTRSADCIVTLGQ